MRLFIDTEFNEFQGALISMALVPETGLHNVFYESLGCAKPGPWVAEHVMPIIGKEPIGLATLQDRLQLFLSQWDEVTIVADWHEDIIHFCAALTTGPGMRINTPSLNFQIRRDLDTVPSRIPHNALEDALAMRLSANKNAHC
jgi:hypothetical protein